MSDEGRHGSIIARWLRVSSPMSILADAQAFLQERIALFLRILFVVFATFTAAGAIKGVALARVAGPEYHDAAVIGVSIFAGVTALLGLEWLLLWRGQRSVTTLHVIESVGTVAACAALAHVIRALPTDVPEFGVFLPILLTLVIRAAVVPSTAGRTMVVGLLSIGALTAMSYQRAVAAGDAGSLLTNYSWTLIGTWGVIFAVVTSIVSRVIYGLQNTVRAAMQLGNYTLDKKIGEGAMGVVYLARHAMLRRATAVKLLRPEKAGEHNVVRFEREVQHTSRLTHPNIIEIYDYGRTPDGIFYYAMEYLEGVNIGELIELEGPQPPGRVIYVVTQVAHALAHAHDEGLIHRDIKPANIVLCNRGGLADMAKVVDFGLVKELEAAGDIQLSGINTITGTPMYMAPEALAEPGQVDGRTDLYSLGAVAYYMLTGTHVFDGNSIVEVCGHHLHTPPERPSQRLGKGVPDDLEHVVLRCLAKRPDDRFANAAALRDALLSCRDAARWGLREASAWWARRERDVALCCENKFCDLDHDDTVLVPAERTIDPPEQDAA